MSPREIVRYGLLIFTLSSPAFAGFIFALIYFIHFYILAFAILILLLHSCSLQCYNNHVKVCEKAVQPSETPSSAPSSTNTGTSQDTSRQQSEEKQRQWQPSETAESKVPEHALLALKHSESIRAALRSQELQGIIHRIDGAGTDMARVAALRDELELNPRFLEFIQETLNVVDKEIELHKPSSVTNTVTGNGGT